MTLLVAAFVAAAPLLPALLAGRALFYRDVGQYYLPNRALTLTMLSSGECPLWNPLRGAGQPFLANPNSLFLRPTTLLFLPFPKHLAHLPLTLSVMALFGIAAAGTWALLRESGRSPSASLLGAAAFSLSGALQSLGQLLNHLEAVAWMPVTLWLLQRALLRGWSPWGILSGFAFGLVVSAGEPLWIVITALAAAALPAVRTSRTRCAQVFTAAAITGTLFSAAAILPLLEVAARSDRGAGLDPSEVLKWSLPPQALAQAILPTLWGDPTRSHPEAYWGSGLFDTSLPWLLSLHLGAPIVLLAAVGALPARERGGETGAPRGALLAALAVSGVVLSLGRYTPVYPFLVRWLPGAAAARYPIKWFVLTTWCAAILAAEGFDRLTRGEARAYSRSRIGVALAAVMGAPAVLGAVAAAGRLPAAAPLVRAVLLAPAAFDDATLARGAVRGIGWGVVLACGATLIAGILLPRRKGLAALACVTLLLAASWGLNPSAPPGVIFERSPLLAAMPASAAGETRFFGFPRPPRFAFRTPSEVESLSAGLPPDSLAWGMRWDARTLRNATPFAEGIRGAFDRMGDSRLDLLPGAAVARRLGEGMPLEEAVRLLSAASVQYILAYDDLRHPDLREVASLPGESNVPVRLYESARALPRAYLVERALPVGDGGEAIEAIRIGRADPVSTVMIEPTGEIGSAGAHTEAEAGPDRGGAPGEAAVVRDGACEVVVRVAAQRRSWLVLTDTYEPSWRAHIGDAAAEVVRANGMFRAVRVPEGEHEVRFTYRPLSFLSGCAVSVLAALGGVIVILARRPGSP